MFKVFSEKSLRVEKQYLQDAQSEQFPYNIILTEPTGNDTSVPPVYFLISAEDAALHIDLLEGLALNGNVVILANLHSDLPEGIRKYEFPGLSTFLSEAPEDSRIVFLSLNRDPSTSTYQIIPGGNGHVSQRSILRPMMSAFRESGLSYGIQSYLTVFYRLDLSEGSDETAFCLENGFQALELVLPAEPDTDGFLSVAASFRNLSGNEPQTYDSQYSLIYTAAGYITISEQLYFLILFAIIFFPLLLTCIFSFIAGSNSIENRKDFLRYWYTGPLLEAVSITLIYAAQFILTWLLPEPKLIPTYAIIIKYFIVALMFLFLCLIRHIIPFPQTDYIYGLFSSLAAFLLIYAGALVDMTLIPLFTFIYIIAFVSRFTKNTWILSLSLLVMVFPLVYILFKVMPYLRLSAIEALTSSSLNINIFSGLLILPYLLMVVRIFISTGVWRRREKKLFILLETAILLVLFAIVMSLSVKIYSTIEVPEPPEETAIQDSDGNICFSTDGLIEGNRMLFSIEATSSRKVIRYDITASSEASIPLYSANLPFVFSDDGGSVTFMLDENPVNPFIISGTASPDCPLTFSVTAWLSDIDSLLVEEHTVIIESEPAGKQRVIKETIF